VILIRKDLKKYSVTMTSSSNFLHIRRGVESSGNKPESPYVEVGTMFEKLLSMYKGTIKELILRKILIRVR
jgi:hypothetical protein